jgi:hypothetical protein
MELSVQFQAPAGTHWIGGLMGLKARLDNVEKRKMLLLLEIELRSSSP